MSQNQNQKPQALTANSKILLDERAKRAAEYAKIHRTTRRKAMFTLG